MRYARELLLRWPHSAAAQCQKNEQAAGALGDSSARTEEQQMQKRSDLRLGGSCRRPHDVGEYWRAPCCAAPYLNPAWFALPTDQ